MLQEKSKVRKTQKFLPRVILYEILSIFFFYRESIACNLLPDVVPQDHEIWKKHDFRNSLSDAFFEKRTSPRDPPWRKTVEMLWSLAKNTL